MKGVSTTSLPREKGRWSDWRPIFIAARIAPKLTGILVSLNVHKLGALIADGRWPDPLSRGKNGSTGRVIRGQKTGIWGKMA